MKRIKIRALEGLSVFVVCLHVKGRFPVKYLSSRNEISDFNIYTAIGCGCNCCHMGIDSQQNYDLDSFWNSSSASLEWICHEGTSGVAQARQHILIFGRSATNSEPLLHSMYSCYSRCHERCSHAYDCRRMQMTYFPFTSMMQRNQSAHIACSTQFCGYCLGKLVFRPRPGVIFWLFMNMSYVTTNRLNLDDEVIPCNFSSMANRYFARSFRRSR